MAQFAVHIATGVTLGNKLAKDRSFQFGALIGAFSPDLDFIPMLLVYLINPELALSFHRSASHSLFLPVLAFIVGSILSVIPKGKRISRFLTGLSIGLLSHIALDILFWFDSLKVLWPLDNYGISTEVDIWSGINIPTIMKNILGPTGEFLFYGLLFRWLKIFNFQGKTIISRNLNIFEKAAFTIFGIFVILSFLLPESKLNEFAYGTTSFTFAPISLIVLWEFRNVIFIKGQQAYQMNAEEV